MQTKYWPLMAGLALCLTTALGSVAYMFSGGESPLLALSICALALTAGQALTGTYAALQADLAQTTDRQLFKKIGKLDAEQNDMQKQTNFALAELSDLKAQDQARGEAMIQSLGELKTSYQALVRSLMVKAADGNDRGTAFAPAPAKPPHETENPSDNLEISLEPIVDLVTGRTAHYRFHLDAHNLTGQRPELDLFGITEALRLLQRLHQRDPHVKLFMSIADETLSSPPDMLRLLETLRGQKELAESVVFELLHVRLAGLSSSALEGLGSLARSGQPLALANISITGLDPLALQGLNVRHVSLDANTMDLRPEATANYMHFAQMARIANVQIMLANVMDASALSQLRQLARLGSGPAFAAPRRVRRDAAPLPVGLAA